LHASLFFLQELIESEQKITKRPLELKIGKYVALAYCGGFRIFAPFIFYAFSSLCVCVREIFSFLRLRGFNLYYANHPSLHDKSSFIIGGT